MSQKITLQIGKNVRKKSLFYIVFTRHPKIYKKTQFNRDQGMDQIVRHANPSICKTFVFSKTPGPFRRARPASYVRGNAGPFFEVTVGGGEGVELHHAYPSKVEFRNDWNCTSIPTKNVHGTDREKFTIAFFGYMLNHRYYRLFYEARSILTSVSRTIVSQWTIRLTTPSYTVQVAVRRLPWNWIKWYRVIQKNANF